MSERRRFFITWIVCSIPGLLFLFIPEISIADKEIILIALTVGALIPIGFGVLALAIGLRDGDLPSHYWDSPRTILDDWIPRPLNARDPDGQPIGLSLVLLGAIAMLASGILLFGVRLYQLKFPIPSKSEIGVALEQLGGLPERVLIGIPQN